MKPFDPSQIATECFGGEMTSKTYDSVSDKFMDFSFEKVNICTTNASCASFFVLVENNSKYW